VQNGGCCGLFPCPARGWVAAGALLGQRDQPQAQPSFGLEQVDVCSSLASGLPYHILCDQECKVRSAVSSEEPSQIEIFHLQQQQ